MIVLNYYIYITSSDKMSFNMIGQCNHWSCVYDMHQSDLFENTNIFQASSYNGQPHINKKYRII